ncbi:exonuclease sbcCD subunit D [Cohaesibacter celericrescens]|uniref:Nuclease SbcCD subunit D n=1 Tax=Cohaesibacter celericrescens TaxID=2067669 RepID=A0A2N5XMI3_9HYPH|nr:exonuclease sbcCD subunit D [Cohaesibacter celericrescens]
MRVLHTADWHIGQTLNGWSRHEEHRIWFERLGDVIEQQAVDVLIVAGDIYDGINPSGESQKLLYSALRSFKDRRPELCTVITSGNHDPTVRLEAPGPILASLDVHVIATMRHIADAIDYAQHMIPLCDASGTVRAWVCAIPFLRAADLPGLSFAADEKRGSPIVEAARRFHADMAEAALAHAGGLPILAMGHLHCHGATESEGAERRILIGGEHALSEDVFPEAFDYVALGHLHRPQNLDGGRIRYSGSCFPLSAAEISYDHGVTLIDIDAEGLRKHHLSIERPVEMIRLPAQGAMTFEAFEVALEQIALQEDLPKSLRPFVYVNLQATGPASVLLADVEKLLAKYPLRTAGVRVQRLTEQSEQTAPISLAETTPEELFRKAFESVNATTPDEQHISAFRDAATGA